MKQCVLLSLLLVLPLFSYSQETVEVRNNRLKAYISSNGALTSTNSPGWLSYEQDGEFVPLVHQAGLWLGGLNEDGNLFISDTRNGALPGPRLPMIGDSNPMMPFNKVWRVRADDIAAHVANLKIMAS